MDWEAVVSNGIGILTMIGVFVLALQRQRVERPLAVAQTEAASMTNVESQMKIMGMAHNLTTAQQNTEMERLRGDMERQKNAHEKEVAILRAEMAAKIELLNKEIVDLKALLADSRKETTEAKQETVKAEAKQEVAEAKTEAPKPPDVPLVPLPFPVTLVDPPPAPEGKSP